MARLASDAKMGFYATSVETIKKVVEKTLFIQPNTIVVDPCCGEGDALASFNSLGCGQTYGIELDALRAQEAAKKVDFLLNGDAIYGVRRSLGWAGICFLNPPYGTNARGGRTELDFVKNWGSAVAPGGVMILVINPSSADEDMAKAIQMAGFTPVATLYDEDNEDYKDFGQFFVVLQRVAIGFRCELGKIIGALDSKKAVEINSFELDEKATPVMGKQPQMFKEVNYPEWKLTELYKHSGLNKKFEQLMHTTHTGFGSIETPNEGQSALLIASGVLNKEIDGLILKGTVEKFQVSVNQENDDGKVAKVKMIDCYRTIVIGLDTKTFEFTKYE